MRVYLTVILISALLGFVEGTLSQRNTQTAMDLCSRGSDSQFKLHWQEAIDSYEQAIRIDPTCATAYCCLGTAKNRLGDRKSALALYNKAITLDPYEPGAYFNRGNIRDDLKDVQGAASDYNRSADLYYESGKFGDAYFSRAYAKDELGDKAGALCEYSKAVAAEPVNAMRYVMRGHYRASCADTNGAVEDFNRAAELNFRTKKHADAYSNLGEAANLRGDYSSAIEQYSKAISFDPQNCGLYLSRSSIKLKLKDESGARRDSDRGFKLMFTPRK